MSEIYTRMRRAQVVAQVVQLVALRVRNQEIARAIREELGYRGSIRITSVKLPTNEILRMVCERARQEGKPVRADGAWIRIQMLGPDNRTLTI